MSMRCRHCENHGAARCDDAGCSRVTSTVYSPEQCRPCWLRFHPLPKPTSPAPAIPLPLCIHAGDPSGTGHYCEHPNPTGDPAIPDGAIVCAMGCDGKCTPRCKGYAAPPTSGGVTAGLVIPQPPAMPPEKIGTRMRAVVTVAAGNVGRELLAASGVHLRHYAESVDADFVVLDWPGHPAWPMSAKFMIARTLDHYERIAYIDADVIVRPGAVNLFEMCSEHEFGFVDELPWHRVNPGHQIEVGYQRFREAMGFRQIEHVPWLMNSGVMVVPRSHRELLLPPTKPILPSHCAEQNHIMASLLDSQMPYRLLDRRCNWQNWTDPGFVSAPPDAILHWSDGGGNRARRAADMAKWAAGYPW